MNLRKTIKSFLRKKGIDIVTYHSSLEAELKKLNIKTILDIGANDGVWSLSSRKQFPDSKIYAFEPLETCCLSIQEKMKGDTNFRLFPIALGDYNGQSVIEKSSFNPSSSILQMSNLHKILYPKSSNSQKEKIEIRTLNSLEKEIEINDDMMVKIDVQGFEGAVIRGGDIILSKAKIIIIENAFVTLYEGQPLFDEIYKQVTNLGFRYAGNKEQHYSKLDGTLIYEDSIFVKL